MLALPITGEITSTQANHYDTGVMAGSEQDAVNEGNRIVRDRCGSVLTAPYGPDAQTATRFSIVSRRAKS